VPRSSSRIPRLAPIARSPELTRELYEVAGAVPDRAGGAQRRDPDRMNEALGRAKTDPQGFANSLSPATRARLSAVARS
jgi:hypothetical protein